MAVENGPAGVETFGRVIQRLRRERALTQRQLAAAVGVDFTYLSKVENDRGEPPGEETVRKLADVLEADQENLLALAGKVPAALKELAQQDVEFARFLRRLPTASKADLLAMYKRLGSQPPKS